MKEVQTSLQTRIYQGNVAFVADDLAEKQGNPYLPIKTVSLGEDNKGVSTVYEDKGKYR